MLQVLWHPIVVHFPVALIVTAAILLTLARVLPLVRLPVSARLAATLATVATWNLCLGAVAVFFALGSGLAAVIGLQVDEAARLAISAHVKSAVVTSVLVLLVALWRGVGTTADSRPTWGFLLMLWMATSALTVTGYRGGQNVYRHAVGVETTVVGTGR